MERYDDIQGLQTHKRYLESRLEYINAALTKHDEQRGIILKDKEKVEGLIQFITVRILDRMSSVT
jgi:hypothetical protein